ncbi:hypothetical protein F5I97DRAFT_1965320 [Phlebopus sp. FC_14]|nr:hypothetical protein F5I97DRAFT_1965320 [Phlebopus sp. FC_14]
MNPEIRLLFFRLCALAELPLLPLFVFDGHEKPKVKRGSKLGKSGSHALTVGLKKLLDIFGMEWRTALGRSRGRARLNRTGVLDAVMTDDVDALIFGALRVIKNPSLTLSGNKTNPALNAAGKTSNHHVMIYTAEAIRKHPDVQMSRGGLVLFALLLKSDYAESVKDIGRTTAHALARGGFTVNIGLHTNSRKFLRHAYPSLSLSDNFPDVKLLENYADPLCSARIGRQGGEPMRDTSELDLARAAAFCEEHFVEGGHKSAIVKRFRDLMWEAATMRVLRRAALEMDEKEKVKRLDGGQDCAIKCLLIHQPTYAVGTPISLVKKYLNMTTLDRRREGFLNHGEPNAGTAGTGRLISKISSDVDPSRPSSIPETLHRVAGTIIGNGPLQGSSQSSHHDPSDYTSNGEEGLACSKDPFEPLFNEVTGFDKSTETNSTNSTRRSKKPPATRARPTASDDHDRTVHRPVKKRKTRHTLARDACEDRQRAATGPSRIRAIPTSDPNVIDLSDSEEEISFSKLPPSKPYIISMGPKEPKANLLPSKAPHFHFRFSSQ